MWQGICPGISATPPQSNKRGVLLSVHYFVLVLCSKNEASQLTQSLYFVTTEGKSGQFQEKDLACVIWAPED